MCEAECKNAKLTESQKEYVAQFGGDLLAVINSQLHLCGPNPEIGKYSVKELTISAPTLLELLHLNTDEPDNMSLLERLLFLDDDKEDPGKKSFGIFLTAKRMEKFIDRTILAKYRTGEFVPSEEQEAVLRNIASVFDRQITREGNACTIAQVFALKFLEYRPEYLSQEAILRLTVTQALPVSKEATSIFGHDFSIEDIIQLYGLELRAGTPLEEIAMTNDPGIQESLKATALFWANIARGFADLMSLKAGKVTDTCHPNDFAEFVHDKLAAQALNLRKLHAEMSQ